MSGAKLSDAYAEPANFLEIDVVEAKTTGVYSVSVCKLRIVAHSLLHLRTASSS